MTDKEFNERAAEIEKIIGRQPTLSEVQRGDLDRPDTRSVRDKVFAWDKRVPMSVPGDPLEQQLQQAREKIQKAEWWNRYVKASFDQRNVMDLESLVDQREDSRESAKLLKDHLTAMEPELQPLRQLRETMRWNPDYTVAEVEAVEWAIQVGTTPGHDTAAFRKLRNDVLQTETARVDKIIFDREAKIQSMRAEIEQLSRSKPQQRSEPEVEVSQKLARIKEVKIARVKRLREAGNEAAADAAERRYSDFRNKLSELGTSDAAFDLVNSEYAGVANVEV
jgi:hypothetical protein